MGNLDCACIGLVLKVDLRDSGSYILVKSYYALTSSWNDNQNLPTYHCYGDLQLFVLRDNPKNNLRE